MKKNIILTAIALIGFSVVCSAQAKDISAEQNSNLFSSDSSIVSAAESAGAEHPELVRFHGALMFKDSNRYLQSPDVDINTWKKYYNAREMQQWGQYFYGLGIGYLIGDLVGNLVWNNGRIIDGYAIAICGVCALIGAPLDIAGYCKIGKIADNYNAANPARKAVTLNIGPTSSGFGLALKF